MLSGHQSPSKYVAFYFYAFEYVSWRAYMLAYGYSVASKSKRLALYKCWLHGTLM